MRVVSHAANRERLKIVPAGDSCDIRPKLLFEFRRNEDLAFFRGENTMYEKAVIGVRHGT